MIKDYTVIDLETTGLSIKRRKIIEVALIKVRDNEIVGSFTSLINPLVSLEERIIDLTGLNDEILRKEKSIDELIKDIIDFIGADVLLGHNVLFDFSFLKKEAINNSINFDKKGIDTFDICKKVLPTNLSKSLESACEYFGIIIEKKHRAYEDAFNTFLLYKKLCSLNLDLEIFKAKDLIFKYKKEKKARAKEKEDLKKLFAYHKIPLTIELDKLSSNDIARLRDNIISKKSYIKI